MGKEKIISDATKSAKAVVKRPLGSKNKPKITPPIVVGGVTEKRGDGCSRGSKKD
jgi:hypothetical protein